MEMGTENLAKSPPDVMSELSNFRLINAAGVHPVTDPKLIKGVAFLHIGKTGGTSVQDYAVSVCAKDKTANLLVLRHSSRLPKIVRAFPGLKFAFFIREPIERIISSFNCRMVNGRPRYNDRWNAKEAITFSFFEDHNAFLKALIGDDERLKSAAIYGLRSISHIRRNYTYHFGKPRFIKRNPKRFVFIGDSDLISEQFDEFCVAVDLPTPQVSGIEIPHAHKSKIERRFVGTNTDRRALRITFKPEYDVYNHLKRMAKNTASE